MVSTRVARGPHFKRNGQSFGRAQSQHARNLCSRPCQASLGQAPGFSAGFLGAAQKRGIMCPVITQWLVATLCSLSAAFAASTLLVQGARTKRQASNDSSATFSRCQAKRESTLRSPPQGLNARPRPPLVTVGELLESGRVKFRGAEVNIGHMWPSGDRKLCAPVSVAPCTATSLCFVLLPISRWPHLSGGFHGRVILHCGLPWSCHLDFGSVHWPSCILSPSAVPSQMSSFSLGCFQSKIGPKTECPNLNFVGLSQTSGKRISLGKT